MRKLLFAGVLALGSMAMAATGALAADWTPPGPIKLMIAFKAGGGSDTQARLIAEELEKRHGWKILPENVVGKGGANLARTMKDEANDGTVIGIAVTETYGYNMLATKNAGYTQADFTPLTTTTGFQMGIVALTSKGWGSWDDFVAAAKADTLRFGTMSPRLADVTYLLGKHLGVEFNIVPVKGGKGSMNGLNAGDLDVAWGAGIQTKSVVAGDMVNLASTMNERLKASPDAPTFPEIGFNHTVEGYFLFSAPAGIPDDARTALTEAIAEIVNDENTGAGKLVRKAFGGAVTIKGAELEALLAADAEAAKALLAATSE
ncbi:MAG: tripartite tricarboxylate transporter substrate-binding protein [Pseudomonadota bacterium]